MLERIPDAELELPVEEFQALEPEIAALANSPDSLIGMVAAGHGVFLGPELSIRGKQEAWRSAGDFYPLTGPDNHCDLLAIWKKQCPTEPTVYNFIDVLVAELIS